jgi:hypothetical protein
MDRKFDSNVVKFQTTAVVIKGKHYEYFTKTVHRIIVFNSVKSLVREKMKNFFLVLFLLNREYNGRTSFYGSFIVTVFFQQRI